MTDAEIDKLIDDTLDERDSTNGGESYSNVYRAELCCLCRRVAEAALAEPKADAGLDHSKIGAALGSEPRELTAKDLNMLNAKGNTVPIVQPPAPAQTPSVSLPPEPTEYELNQLRASLAAMTKERDEACEKFNSFKAVTHDNLTALGVPAFADKECRLVARFDWLRASLAAATKERDEFKAANEPLIRVRNAAIDRAETAERERDLAIAHDRQPYPTAAAYEAVCKARDGWQVRAETAEKERDDRELKCVEMVERLKREKYRLNADFHRSTGGDDHD